MHAFFQKNDFHTGCEKLYCRITQNNYFDVISSSICAIFIILLFAGHYFKNYQLLYGLNILKFLIIPLFSLCIYKYYRNKSKTILIIIVSALLLTWFSGFDFAYRWDAIQHVVRAKYYLSHPYLGSTEERHSLLYLIWGRFYRLFGESEALTHLINMFLDIFGIFGIYAISKELYEDLTAFIALIVTLMFPVFILVNKWAYLDMPFTSFVIIAFLFLFKYINTRSNRFFYLSLLFSFIAFSIKVPGLVLFPAIFLCLVVYHQITRKTLISIVLMFLISIIYYFETMYYSKIMDDFSIITPLNFGIDAIAIWAGFLKQELSQYIYSGILFFSIFAFLKIRKKDKPLLYSLLGIQILLIVMSEMYPSKLGFWFPLIPFDNYRPYYILLGLLILCLLGSVILNRTEIEIGRKELAMLIWIAAFSSFFLINGKITGYGLKPAIDTSLLDYRYLMPAFPALIILFSSSISKILRSDYSEKIKFIVVFILASTLIFNFITAANWTFYYANSGNARLEGYEELSKQNPDAVYTHWPFYYVYNYDVGGFKWKNDNINVRDINIAAQSIDSGYVNETEDKAFLLFDTYFYSLGNLMNINSEKIEAKTYILNPLFTSVTEKTVNSVYISKLERGSIILNDGFYNVEFWENKPVRWMKNNSTLYLYSDTNLDTTLSMEVMSFYRARSLEIHVDDEPISANAVPTNFTKIEVPLSLKKGMNFIQLTVPEGTDKPLDIPEFGSKDSRDLSIAITEIKLTP
ncbi:ArnT family glycosyltransferase [Methanosarcina sp. T3]|uniref:ArnT family glycosyltransferase n=1 Tax=Methanosarcina sp. T3 TaxID=3439062 RepID=UPI003F830DA9